MRWGFPFFASLLVAALVPGPAGAAHRQLRFQLTFSGRVAVVHTDNGLQANGGGCGLGPDDTSPFLDSYGLSLRWRTTFNVTLRSRQVQIKAHATQVSGGRYGYEGYAYDFNCHEIIYGPGGQACTGTLASGGRGVLTAKGSPSRKPTRLTFAAQPFGLLVATPPECTAVSTPPVTYAAADELSLASLGQTIAHTFSARTAKRARTYRFKLNVTSDCSQPAQSAGETDACRTTYTGSGSLRVRPY